MAQHLVAFTSSQSAGTTNDQLNALTGTAEYVQNNNHVFRDEQPRQIAGIYVMGASLTRARIVSPSRRAVAPQQIRPITRAAAVPTDPNFADYRRKPMLLQAREEISIETTNDLAMGSEQHWAGLWLWDGNANLPSGERYVIRATGTTTLVANTWTNVALTYDDTIPQGRYAIINMECQSAGAVLGRCVSPGETWMRPGVLAVTALGNRTWFGHYENYFGVLTTFVNMALPSIEFLSTSADTAETVFFDVVKIG